MTIDFYQIDAFTSQVFAGNPAGVCFLDSWPDDSLLQSIAMENNLSETAFLLPEGDSFALRWFTPTVEVDLCGHATLASAHALFVHRDFHSDKVIFHTASGELTVARRGELLEMDFPARPPAPCEPPSDLAEILGLRPALTLRARDLMAVFDSEEEVLAVRPDMDRLTALLDFALIVTAPGTKCDFVSRFFAPGAGIPEDPVTGSAHCTLTPYWAKRLGKRALHALQLSSRGGELFCEDRGERVAIAGRAATYLAGSLSL